MHNPLAYSQNIDAVNILSFFSHACGYPFYFKMSYVVLLSDKQCVCQVDPFLRLVEDCKLQVVESCLTVYGSKDDDDLALKSLSNININDQSKQASVSLILDSLKDLSEVNHKKSLMNICLDTFYCCDC